MKIVKQTFQFVFLFSVKGYSKLSQDTHLIILYRIKKNIWNIVIEITFL